MTGRPAGTRQARKTRAVTPASALARRQSAAFRRRRPNARDPIRRQRGQHPPRTGCAEGARGATAAARVVNTWITTLPMGTRVTVLERADGGDWYRVARGGAALGYVYAPLIRPR